MIKVGLTGGIGSGKSTIAQYFKGLGIPVYHADDEAKRLMHTDLKLQEKIRSLFGDQAYENGLLQRQFIAEIVFNDPRQLQALNSAVHPAVADDFANWCLQQKTPYVIQENALIIETKAMSRFDRVIAVIVSKEIRIKRVMKRDGVSRKKVLLRMAQQCGDKERRAQANYIIHNKLSEKAMAEVLEIHENLLRLAAAKS